MRISQNSDFKRVVQLYVRRIWETTPSARVEGKLDELKPEVMEVVEDEGDLLQGFYSLNDIEARAAEAALNDLQNGMVKITWHPSEGLVWTKR